MLDGARGPCLVPAFPPGTRCKPRSSQVYWAVVPPSITNSAPVTKDDSSEAR
jgi:hypothetical protein